MVTPNTTDRVSASPTADTTDRKSGSVTISATTRVLVSYLLTESGEQIFTESNEPLLPENGAAVAASMTDRVA